MSDLIERLKETMEVCRAEDLHDIESAIAEALDALASSEQARAEAERELRKLDPDREVRCGEPCGYPRCGCDFDGTCEVVVDRIAREGAEVRARAAERERDSLQARVGELEADKARLDWLEMQCVEVRTPLFHGSLANFKAVPDDSIEGEDHPSGLRTKIDAALDAEVENSPVARLLQSTTGEG